MQLQKVQMHQVQIYYSVEYLLDYHKNHPSQQENNHPQCYKYTIQYIYSTEDDYSLANWDGFCDNLKDIPQNNIFELGAFELSTAASKFCECIQVAIDIYASLIHLHGFQVFVLLSKLRSQKSILCFVFATKISL